MNENNLRSVTAHETIAAMDYLFTPWRYAYLQGAEAAEGCIFCEKSKSTDDRGNLIVQRARHCYVILNAFPYTSGHIMVVPYAHVDSLQKLAAEAAAELMAVAQQMEGVLRELYRPEGINLGMNIGKAAGAGVAGHIHLHVLPRWTADSNFMTVVGETRVLPEALEVTYVRFVTVLKRA